MLLGPNVFACFVMISIISDAASQAVDQMANGNAGIRSVNRIQQYLLQTEVPDWRRCEDDSPDSPDNHDNHDNHDNPHFDYPRVDPASPFGVDVRSISVASPQGHDIIQDLTMQLVRGRIAVVYGTEPFGKSTLARAILGEVPFHAGSVTLAQDCIAFCGQDSWVQNQTIEANIVGRHTLYRSWYNRIIGACLLGPDINRLPERGQTMAGSNGCNFDTSFKQRIVSRWMASRGFLTKQC